MHTDAHRAALVVMSDPPTAEPAPVQTTQAPVDAWAHSPGRRQLCAAHERTCRINPGGRRAGGRRVGGAEGGLCGGWCVYLHTSLQRRKTHPDTPR